LSASVVTNTCRLTIISPTLRVDLAVPMQISIAELLTIVVSGLGPEMADKGAAEGGWVLQRAGQAPLDPSSTLAASELRDGDTLQLRTRSTRLPELAFDDVLDAVADGVLTRTSRWLPLHTMRACATLAGALLIFAVVTLLLSGPGWTPKAVTAGVAAVLLVLGAAALARVYHRRAAAITAGAFAIALAAVGGMTGVGDSHRIWHFGAPQVLVGACAAALVATVLVIVLAAGVAGFVAVITTALLTAIGTGIATGTTLSPSGTAAVVATAGLALSPLLPTLSFRLSRMPLPTIPFDAADLRRENTTIDAQAVLGRAVRADQFLTGLAGGVALAIAGAAVLVSGGGVSQRILAVVLGLICLLRGRLFTGRAQRGLLLTSGAVALLAVLARGAADTHGTTRLLAFVVPAVVVALVLLAFAVVLPERRYAPPVSRAADVLESLLVLSVIPLALAVMGVYGSVRELYGK
jgi:ESX secretion system protein EccD